MILRDRLSVVGKVNKTHGIAGELSLSFFAPEYAEAVNTDSCLIMDMDGIPTPFFVDAVRPRGSEALLVILHGVGSQQQASAFVGKEVFMETEFLPAIGYMDEDGEGLYAGQLVGFKAFEDNGSEIGVITDIDESTENVLFVITDSRGATVLVPVVDEFIADISLEDKTITFDLPEGLI